MSKWAYVLAHLFPCSYPITIHTMFIILLQTDIGSMNYFTASNMQMLQIDLTASKNRKNELRHVFRFERLHEFSGTAAANDNNNATTSVIEHSLYELPFE